MNAAIKQSIFDFVSFCQEFSSNVFLCFVSTKSIKNEIKVFPKRHTLANAIVCNELMLPSYHTVN